MTTRWSRRALRYRDTATGRFVARKAVIESLEKGVSETASRMRAVAAQLQAGQINLVQFELDMRDLIKKQHILSAGIAQGGKAQLSPAALGKVGSQIKEQYQFLGKMVREIESGRQPLNGRLLTRVDLYAKASRGTFSETERKLYRDSGYDEERNVLHPAEHCEGCLTENGKGWVQIGTLVPIGQRTCRVNDQCTLEFRKAA